MIALYLDTRDPFQIQMLWKEVNVISAMMLVKRTELSQRNTYQYVWFTFCLSIKKTKTLDIKPTISFYAFLEYILQRSQKKKIARMKKKERLKELRKQKKEMKRQGATKTNCGSKNILTFVLLKTN